MALLICFFSGAGAGFAEPEEIPPAPSSEVSELAKIRELIETNLESEQRKVDELKTRLDDLKRRSEAGTEKFKAYELQLSAHSNLLMGADTRVDEIENALGKHKTALDQVDFYLKDWEEKLQDAKRAILATRDQVSSHQEQLKRLREDLPKNPVTESLIQKEKDLLQTISEKLKIFQELEETYTRDIGVLENIRRKLTDFSSEFEQRLKEKRKTALFQRETKQVNLFDMAAVRDELYSIPVQSRARVAGDLQILQIRFRESGYFPLFAFFVLFGILLILLYRLQGYCQRVAERHQLQEQKFWRHLLLRLFRRSLLVLGATLFLLAYGYIRDLYNTLSVFRVAFYLCCIWLFTRWGLCFLKIWNQDAKQPIPEPLTRRFRSLILLVRGFAMGYVLLVWALGGGGAVLLWARLFFEITLVVRCILFWRLFFKEFETTAPTGAAVRPHPKFWMVVSYFIALSALLLEMAGYGSLAVYCLTSWGLTAGFFLWGWLAYRVLVEERAQHKAYRSNTPAESQPAFPIRWVMIQLGWLFWIGGVTLTLIFTWKIDKTEFLASYFRFLSVPITIGNFRLSIIIVVYVILALILTHAAVRVWQNLFVDQILAESGIDRGLKNSITVIVSYLLWGVGILISLNIIGFSSQSLAVILGALGIGLGFGLQNIFNNFFSGIILLFERPIQVGDAVEINGVWGEVKKINIRATQVQTYDNAALIIPNSEFVSSQVTNWSFKDMRIRRQITVGVAYGSNIELARDTLLEIADNNRYIFKYPKPNVLFTDFGDNALIFKLRVWTDVDNCLTAETEIRFEIDRLFRERGIEIAFPQRDLHIRSIAKEVLESLKPAPAPQQPLEWKEEKS